MIKICGVRDNKTAEVAVEAGADAIGLVFAESPRRVTVAEALAVVDGLPRGIERIGVFRRMDLRLLPSILEQLDLDAIQVHRAEDLPSVLHGREVIPGIRVEYINDFKHARVLVDSPIGEGSGVAWNFGDARRFASARRVILAGGLKPDNVGEAIELTRPYGVDVSSGVESAPGIKDHGRVRAFVQAAKAAMDKAGAKS
ncbi:MAG: phosphoribosylanthranilate isomerase [Planctomycetes bacterium]|mgnify:CR=1 FL=1|nr:phosphoribosylanthranilate isomerase [Planctomycetota bacterium]